MKELTGETASGLEAQITAMKDRAIAKANGFHDEVAFLDASIADIASRTHELPKRKPKSPWFWMWLRD